MSSKKDLSEKEVEDQEYRDAVLGLLAVTRLDTWSSPAAAQVLLSLYNGHRFHMDLTDLYRLDSDLIDAAIIAMRGRARQEPQDAIENGEEIFEELARDWSGLDVRNRYARHYAAK